MKNAKLITASKKAPFSLPHLISADKTIKDAADLMRAKGCSILGVGHEQYVEGVIGAYDIVTQAIAQGKNPATTKISEVMTRKMALPQPAKPTPRPHIRKQGMLTYGSGIRT